LKPLATRNFNVAIGVEASIVKLYAYHACKKSVLMKKAKRKEKI
jgi:hypothetical protein